MVEIVGVLVVAQQHRVDLADCIRGQGRTRSLGQGDIAQPVLTGSIEGGLSDEAEAARFDQHGRSADERDVQCHRPVT
jgi:hypothetical protein